MADCNRLINNTPRATSAYMNALRYNYPDSIVNLRLGQMYHKSGRYGEAIKYYNDYLLAEPGSILAFNGITGCEEARSGNRIRLVMWSSGWRSLTPAVPNWSDVVR